MGIGDCGEKIADFGRPAPVGPEDGDAEPILAKGLRRCDKLGAFDAMILV